MIKPIHNSLCANLIPSILTFRAFRVGWWLAAGVEMMAILNRIRDVSPHLITRARDRQLNFRISNLSRGKSFSIFQDQKRLRERDHNFYAVDITLIR